MEEGGRGKNVSGVREGGRGKNVSEVREGGERKKCEWSEGGERM